MKKILSITLLSILLVSCASNKQGCLEKICVDSKEASGISEKTKKMYRDIGYRVPIYIPAMNYPYELRRQGIEATLVVSIDISTEGYVVDGQVKSSTVAGLFDQSVLDYVSKYKFEPSETKTKGQLQRVTYKLR